MLTFIIPFSFIYGLIQFYLYRRLTKLFGQHHKIFAIVWLIISIILIILPAKEVAQTFGNSDVSALTYAIGFTWLGFAFLLAFSFFVLDIIRLITKKTKLDKLYNFVSSNTMLMCLIGINVFAIAYGLHTAQHPKVMMAQIETNKLPEHMDRFRIVQLSDIHIGPMFRGQTILDIVNQVNAQQPDLIVITGDTVERNMKSYTTEASMLSQMKARYGRFVIEGNHEHYAGITQALAFLKLTGFSLLRNDIVDAGPMVIIGATDPSAGPEVAPDAPVLDFKNMNLPNEKFVLLLKHQPRVSKEAIRIADLQLSGHTHRGQIAPFYPLTRLIFNHHPDFSIHGRMALYISNGTGFWGPPIRIFAPPEITVIDLVAKAK